MATRDDDPGSVDWREVAIVGVGLIGGSLALGLKHSGRVERVVGVSSPKTIADATSMGVIDGGGSYDELPSLIRNAGVIILCAPIATIIELIPAAIDAACPGAVVTDVGSTKGEIVRAAESAARPGVTFIGGHPMAGSEHSGVGASDPFLFQNAIYVVTPTAGTPDALVGSFADGLADLGARVLRLDPETHDRVAAGVSHLPQLLSLALVEFVGARNEDEAAHLQMAAGGFRDMTRIASSPYRMWRDILATNGPEIHEAMDEFRSYLDAVDRDVGNSESHFERANRTRNAIPKDAKGFLTPLCDVLVRLEDRPGMLALMTGALADEGVNVKDIELLKIREGEGGTIRLAFADANDANRAVELLAGVGLGARLR